MTKNAWVRPWAAASRMSASASAVSEGEKAGMCVGNALRLRGHRRHYASVAMANAGNRRAPRTVDDLAPVG